MAHTNRRSWTEADNKQQPAIGFNSCTLESDNFICVRQKVDENASPEVIIVNLKNANSVMKRPIKADSAIMHCTTYPDP